MVQARIASIPQNRPSTRRAEAARAARGILEALDLDPIGLRVALHDQLGDALAARDREGVLAGVEQNHAHFATVVGIDRAGAVQDRDAVFEGEARAGPDLGLVARWQSNGETRRHERAGAWCEC